MNSEKQTINFALDGRETSGRKPIVVKWYYGYRLNCKYIPLNFSTGFTAPIASNDEIKLIYLQKFNL